MQFCNTEKGRELVRTNSNERTNKDRWFFFFCTEVLHLQLTNHLWNVGGSCWVAARSCCVLVMYNMRTPKIVSKSVSQKIQGKWKRNKTSWVAFIQWQNAVQMGFLSLHPTGQAAWEEVITLKFKGMGQGSRAEEGGEQGTLGRSGYKGDLMPEWSEREKWEGNFLEWHWDQMRD